MLNRVILMGRITQDLEIRQVAGGTSVLTFNIAVDRSFVRQGEERQADFITCVAWRQQAEFINKYFGKGRMIALEGNLRSRVYEDKNGTKHYITEVYVDSVSFTGEKANESSSYGNYTQRQQASIPAYNEPSQTPLTVGGLDEFEDILSDDGVPF